MTTVTNSAISKIVAVTAGLAMVASFAFVAPARAASLTSAQVQSILSLLSSFGADSTTIANVQSSLTGVPVSGTTGGTTTTTSSCDFTGSLTIGAKGAEVTCLQTALIGAGYTIPAGATGYFGNQTRSAVAAWQKATGVAPAVGYFGSISRAHWNLGSTVTASNTTSGTTGETTAMTGNGLKVALAATSPNGTVLVQAQGIANLGEFTFSNPTSASINVTSLSFNRIGVSNDSTLTNVYLYKGVNRITDSAGVSASVFSFSNSAGLFTVPAGGTYTVSVRSDIAGSTSGQQVGVALSAVGSTGTLDTSVSFPVNSGLQTISAASLAGVDFSGTVLPSANSSLSPTADYTIWQQTVSVSTNPVKFTSIKFTNLGSIDASNIQNIRLYVDGTQVGTAVSQLNADRTVSFDLSTSPVMLSTSSHIVKVVANVTGGSSRTFQLSLQRGSDAMFVDNQLNQPVTPTVSSATFSAQTSGLQTIASVSGSTGVSVSKAAASPMNDIATGSTNVKLASFNLLVTGEDVKVQDLYVFASTTSDGSTDAAYNLSNGKIMVNGVQVGSTKTIGGSATNAASQATGSSLIIPAGTVTTIDIYADAKTSAGVNIPNTGTVKVSLKASTSNGQGQSSLNAVNIPSSSDVSGNNISVTSSALTATKFFGYGDQTMLPGTDSARIGSFTLSAGAAEGVNVNTIAMNLSGYAGVTNLMLKDNTTGVQLGSTVTTPSASGNTFSVNFTIPASGTKTIDVYGNLLTTASGSVQATLTTSTAGTGAVTATNAALTGTKALQSMTIGTGLLTIARSASNPVNANVIAGASTVEVNDYTFTSQTSPYTVSKLEFQIPNGVATSTNGLTLSYTDANGATQTATGATTLVSGGPATVTFTGLSFYVPKDDSADVKVLVGIPTIANGATSGAAITTTLLYATGFQAIDSTGNATTSVGTANVAGANGSYGTMTVRKTLPTFAGQSYTTTSMPNSGTDLFKFNVSADAAGATELYKVSFNVSTSTGGESLTDFTLYDVTSGTPVSIGTATNANSSNIVTITPTNVISVGAGSTKTFTLRAGTYTGTWGTHNSITVRANSANSSVATNAAAASVSGNYVWSDRSAAAHSTSTSDWTNGYLLKNLTDGTYSFSN